MPNLTLAIPEELHEKMKIHTEIRWSEVVRRSIANKIKDLEILDKITKKSKLTQKDVDKIAEEIDTIVAKKI